MLLATNNGQPRKCGPQAFGPSGKNKDYYLLDCWHCDANETSLFLGLPRRLPDRPLHVVSPSRETTVVNVGSGLALMLDNFKVDSYKSPDRSRCLQPSID